MGIEGDHKPSSVSQHRWDDGHLSRALIAQGLKRPHPPRLSHCPRAVGRCEWAVLTPAYRKGAGPIWSCSGWGLPSYPDHSGYWWALTPPFHPYPPRLTPRRRYVFCGTFRISSLWRDETVRITDHPALRSSDFPPLMTHEERPSLPLRFPPFSAIPELPF